MLEQYPRIAQHWDMATAELDIERLEKDLWVMSSGEAAMARFLGGIWLGENRFGFDVIAHLHEFDEDANKTFNDWSNMPFFP